ncbi:hypothetical protein ACFFTM_08450 [Pseudoduganella plicata]|uniref:HEAT repeat domain-containing protein n=1 Tax=Pseudoduganella plicata TaxID=321984 RepID=A0A4P7BAM3_9BURK|nr:hypothetical protein [Pseudoduganella plicata]QBQ35484.1 hypothetical protein E1742_04365 [Pseudoduganella plicata]GGZ02126.1 hypothetical protein GCM10007388_39890 [Pseudoduganella plicata]
MHSEKTSPLHPNALEAMSIEPEDFDEASNALMELERRDKQRAAAVSLRILEGDTGDVFYRAFAFEVLYCAALDDAVSYIEAHAATAEVYVLGAMIDAMTEDSNASADQKTIQRAATLLKKALKVRSPPEIVSISEKISRFEEAYP